MRELLDDAGLAYEIDPTLVRGLDYYTRTLFEFQSGALESAQNAVGGGGRYDRLIEQIGGPRTPGMGWAAGLERMLLARAPTSPWPRRRSISTWPTRRPSTSGPRSAWPPTPARAGHAARLELAGRSLKGQLKQADRAGARYVAILGDEGVSLKDMESGEQKTVEARHGDAPHQERTVRAAAAEPVPRRLGGRADAPRRVGERVTRRRLGAPRAATTAA